MPFVNYNYVGGAMDAVVALSSSNPVLRRVVELGVALFAKCFGFAMFVGRKTAHIGDEILCRLQFIGLRILRGFLLFLYHILSSSQRWILRECRRCETQQDEWSESAHTLWGRFNKKNLKKFARVFNVFEPLPTDMIPVNTFKPSGRRARRVATWNDMFRSPEWEMPTDEGEEGVQIIERVPHRHARVILRFRHGSLPQRLQEKNWTLVNTKYSVTRDLPLEKDGSLLIQRIKDAFYISDINFLVPDRYDHFEPVSTDKISRLGIYTLSQKFGAIHIVEQEDIFCRMRRKFRFWLRSSSFSYFIRSMFFCIAIWFIRTSIVFFIVKETYETLEPMVGLYVSNAASWVESRVIVWMLKSNIFIYSLFTGLFCWRCFNQIATRMGLEKFVPQRRMKHWSKQIEVLIQ